MNNKRALVVDDSKVGRLTMKKRLEAIGVMVDLVESAQQALDYLVQNRPDIIFMDHLMPDMDGFEATRRIKSAPATRDIPVIIISGSDDEAFVQEARSIGANQAITKPPAKGVLEAILGSIQEAVAMPATPVAAEGAPQPVAVERRAAPFMDQAAVHALVERVLGEVVEHLHGDLLAELGAQLQAGLENERKAQRELSERWREQFDQSAAGVADLRRGVMDAETLRQQLNALEQRLLPLESEAGRAVPDIDAVQAQVEQRVASRLAEIQARTERQEPMLESLRQELLARAGDQHAQVEQGIGDLASRLDSLSEEMKRLSDSTLAAESGHDQRFALIEKRLAAIERAEPTPAPDAETLLAAMDTHIAPQLAEMRAEIQAQLDERSPMPQEKEELDEAELVTRLQAKIDEEHEQFMARHEQERAQLAAGLEELQTRLKASDDDWARRFQALAERLDAMAQAGIDDDGEPLLAAMDARIAPRLAEMRNEFQTLLEERSSIPMEETERESLSGQLREQHEALCSELDAQGGQIQAMEEMQAAQEAELAAQVERLRAKIEEVNDGLMSRYEQERAPLAASLEAQQTRLEAWDDGWTHRFQAMEERLDEMARVDIDDGVQRVLEQRIAHMREVVAAALQPAYPGRKTWDEETQREMKPSEDEVPSLMRAQSADEGGGLPKEIEARMTQRLADNLNDRLRAEVVRFEGKVKTLTVMIVVGGVALLAAIAMLALLR